MSTESGGADFSLRIFWSVARWIEDTKGRDVLERVAAAGGVSVADFDNSTRWVSHAQIEALFAAAREIAGDEETFRVALIHRFPESYGAFRHMVWAFSVTRLCQLAVAMSNKVITRRSHFEQLYATRTTYGFRYTSTVPESRLMCLSRKWAWSQSVTLRGIPEAEVIEERCIANGDDCCEYHVRWMQPRALASALLGLGVGVAMAAVAHFVEPSVISAIALPLLGAGAGHLREQRRFVHANIEHAKRAGEALRVVGEAEAETRSEIVALQQRQHEWAARMEREATERDATLDRVVRGLDGLQQSRVSSLRGFSHDLRNPLFVVKANGRLLRERIVEGENADILDDMDAAAGQIETMLGRLMDVATAESDLNKLAPQPVPVAPLADTLRRRLRALVHGRPIDVTVVCADDAPSSIVADRLVFDRVIDNLLTNAAKYTDRGSVVLGIRASRADESFGAGGLVLELADTGRGIAKDRIAEIFRPRPASAPREKDSYGVGLSSAVRLLGQIGGRVELLSTLGLGSTFTVFFPGSPPAHRRVLEDDQDGVIARVVRVVSAFPLSATREVRATGEQARASHRRAAFRN